MRDEREKILPYKIMPNPNLTAPSVDAKALKRVAIVDDHTMMRGGMKLFIESLPDFEFAWTSEDAREAMAALEADVPDILIMDITLPDRNGIELVKDVHAIYPDLPVLMMSMHDESYYALRALKAGAKGYLMKSMPNEVYERALRRVAEGGTWLSEAMSEQMVQMYTSGTKREGDDGLEVLTDREFEVFQLIGEGQSTHQVAAALHISTKTVDVHRSNIRTKLKMEDGSAVVRFAIRWVESRRMAAQ
ncbi:LuxR family two component transcriptional regulator [Prosthecobacter fusiformis]|uniref:LuxR family two component transcriptional regulator n=1 Tax=Prosthecobacter fusiformis TaxID=48464 RepID=A0A4R7SQ53_9BACT|nr:response regulator transcription factor [Prosthecobacter fusiformis]TDU80755.1 LuxR family two component transcriptional regulator [Prosthecobacter fusiformis]